MNGGDFRAARLGFFRLIRFGIKALGKTISRLQGLHKKLRIQFPLNSGFELGEASYGWRLIDRSGQRIALSSRRRAYLYSRGIPARIATLADEYMLKDVPLSEGDLFVDVGANVGELGIWSDQRGLRYVGIEPDPRAFSALQENVPMSSTLQMAVSNKRGVLDFFMRPDSADSTLLKPEDWAEGEEIITVQVSTLDDLLRSEGLVSDIKLLKIEAEGFEPEVLEGALGTLSRTLFVVVDAGPERNGENTVATVVDHLYDHGFKLVRKSKFRETYLFRRNTVDQ